MFPSNNSDDFNSLGDRGKSNSAMDGNSVAIQSNHRISSIGGQNVESFNSSGLHQPNQLLSIAPPLVSVISSSMDFFGPPELKESHSMNNQSLATDTASFSTAANHSTFKFPGHVHEYGLQPTPASVGLKRSKKDLTHGDKSKTTPRSNPKKLKLTSNKKSEKASSSIAFNAGIKNDSDMSFERAAVVAALTTLYGAAVENQDLTQRANTATGNFGSDGTVLMLAKQIQDNGNYPTDEATYGLADGARIETSLMNTSDVNNQTRYASTTSLPSDKSTTNGTGNIIGSTSLKKKGSKNNATNLPPRKVSMTQYPTQYDVLLGRGKSNKNHPGNVWFQDYIQANRDRYFTAATNVQKRQITMEILETIRKKGRFLRRGAQGWVDVCTADVQQKVAHALQYRRRCELRDDDAIDVPQITTTIDHPPHRIPSESNPQGSIQPSTNFDANAIALAMADNFSMAQLDAQTRQEQYRVNQEYYQNYFESLNRASDSTNQNVTGNDSNHTKNDDRVGSILQQQQQQQQLPLYSLAQSHQRRLPVALQPGSASTITDTSSSVAISNLLLSRLRNIDYRNPNIMFNGSNAIASLDPTTASLHVVDTASLTDDQQSSPPSSENLDSSGLHSLADVISQLYSQEEN